MPSGARDRDARPAWRPWCDPARTPWLDDDLSALGCAARPGPHSSDRHDADAAGLFYVIEGSALGATQLVGDAQALGPSIGQRCDVPASAWRVRRGQALAQLRAVPPLEQADFDTAAERRMLESAARAFASAEHEFHRAELADAASGG
jgi:heme oxygenase